MTDRYIFLDIDGVLCNMENLHAEGSSSMMPECLTHLNQIVSRTGCKIVISSSWRIIHTPEQIAAIMWAYGFAFPGSVIGETPHCARSRCSDPYREREQQILEWMSDHNVTAEQIIIVDDDCFMGSLQDRTVCVQEGFYNRGLQSKHVGQALGLFGVGDALQGS